VAVLLPLVLSSIYLSKPPAAKSAARSTPSARSQSVALSLSSFRLIPQSWRPHLQTILHTEASRKIFYFLMVNLAYMGVQMAYGVITNSLGLISDGESREGPCSLL
jgi:zinc transporter 5/7